MLYTHFHYEHKINHRIFGIVCLRMRYTLVFMAGSFQETANKTLHEKIYLEAHGQHDRVCRWALPGESFLRATIAIQVLADSVADSADDLLLFRHHPGRF
jgi:hypothetical protein